MRGLKYDINSLARKADLFRSVFRDKPYPKTPKSVQDLLSLGPREVQSSALGSPLFFPLTLIDESKKRFKLPNAPLIQIQGRKTIVKTAVAGRDFSVKEIISADDYQLKIWGFAVKEFAQNDIFELFSEVFPSNYLSQLNNWYRKNTSLGVECELLRILGINRIVIQEISFPMVEGSLGLLPYEIKAMSDEAVEIDIKGI